MKGIRIYKGIAIAKPLVYVKNSHDVKVEKNKNIDITDEKKKLSEVRLIVEEELEETIDKTKIKIGEKESEIFKAHLMMLKDPMLNKEIEKNIDEGYKAESAIMLARKKLVKQFMDIDNEYIKERIVDIEDVTDRLINNLIDSSIFSLSDIREDVILLAKDLLPSDTIDINEHVKGIIIEEGSKTSHAAIMSRSLGIPSIVGYSYAISEFKYADTLILDSINTNIVINPSKEVLNEYLKKLEDYNKYKKELELLKDEYSVTKDGISIDIYCNVGSINELDLINKSKIDGIGLFRTEFMYMESDHFPTEDEQYRVYSKLAAEGGKEVIIRTLDIGGDKNLPYFNFDKELNPFLGKRAIRFCLSNKKIFKTQLRAILKASIMGNLKIMFPMISSLPEIIEAKKILTECKLELKEEEEDFDEDIPVGIMVEIPSAAIMADVFSKHVDFLSIGTNDLCQYTLAVDRMNKNIIDLYNPANLAVIRMIKKTIEGAHQMGKKVGMCGEMAGDPKYTKILLALGLDEFSMSASSILRVKKVVTESNIDKLQYIKDWIDNGNIDKINDFIEMEGEKC